MKIHIGAKVFCRKESYGVVSCLVPEPANELKTHFLKRHYFPYEERLVSVKHLNRSVSQRVVLDSFAEPGSANDVTPMSGFGNGEICTPAFTILELEDEQVRNGELAV
ncbi:MAG: hypothetical protein KDB79_15615 [Acidobacteria bacterium]|nr:hypothetical protein [Acidobacteriota bacterium]